MAAAIISIIPVVFNLVNGDAFGSRIKTLGTYFAKTTVGNLNPLPDSPTSLTQS